MPGVLKKKNILGRETCLKFIHTNVTKKDKVLLKVYCIV